MTTQKLVKCGLMTAIVLALTLIYIPLPISQGYVNFGDAGVYASAVYIGGGWGVLAAALGSALADLVLGYSIYIPATFIIKGAAAAVALLFLKRMHGFARFFGILICGILIALGYFIYEALIVLGSLDAALVNLPFNAIQAVIGAIAGYAIIKLIKKEF